MRVKIFLFISVMLFAVAFCGCNSQPSSDASADPQITTTQTNQTEKPADMTRVVGKIESIAGNQITLALAESDGEMPDIPENFSMSEGMSAPDGKTPPEGMSRPEGMSFPEGEMPDMENFSMPDFENGEFPEGGKPQFNAEDMEITYTGETAKYIIPVDTKVGMGDYTSLSKGMIISLQLDETDTVKSVQIIGQ